MESSSSSDSGMRVPRHDEDSGEEIDGYNSDSSVNSWLSCPWYHDRDEDIDDGDEVDPAADTTEPEPGPSTSTPIPVRGRGRGRGTTVRGRDNNVNEVIEWEEYDDRDPYSNDWLTDCPIARARTGILVDTTECSELDFFHLLFPKTAVELMVNETNRYAAAELPSKGEYYQNRWKDVTFDEMQAFIGLQIAMGVDPKHNICDYWSMASFLFKNNFSEVMTRHRYQMIVSFLHFMDNTTYIPREQPGYQPLSKIQPLLDILAPHPAAVYYPHKQLSIDESMARFKGRCHFRQYMPDKPTKRGFKIFSLCDSKNFYNLKYTVYTGKDYFEIQGNFSEFIVKSLSADYLDSSHVIYMDNAYTSPELCKYLQSRNTGAVGTVVERRRNYPRGLKSANCPLKKGEDPVFSRSDDLVCVAWHDTKRVSLLSNIHTNNTVNKRVRCRGETNRIPHC